MGREEAIAAAIPARSDGGAAGLAWPHPATSTAVNAASRALACIAVTLRRLVCVVAVALTALAPATALGDAHPASDYLPGFDTYYPFGNAVAKPTPGQP